MSEILNQHSLWLAVTIGAYLIGLWVYQRLRQPAILPPVLTGFLLVTLLLWLSGTSYATYQASGSLLSFFLGPVVVALAIPLFTQLRAMKRQWLRILLAIIMGSGTTVVCAMWMADAWIGLDQITLTMGTKSITTPVAVAVAEEVGAIPALAAAFVMVTGIIGAMIIPLILKLTHQDDPQSMGMALGVCAHAVGTSKAVELGPEYAAFSAMSMTLTASLHAFVLPWLL